VVSSFCTSSLECYSYVSVLNNFVILVAGRGKELLTFSLK
jgi:hypothetical protein